MIHYIITIFLLLFFSCSQEDGININPIDFGSDDSLDIITIETIIPTIICINELSKLLFACLQTGNRAPESVEPLISFSR